MSGEKILHPEYPPKLAVREAYSTLTSSGRRAVQLFWPLFVAAQAWLFFGAYVNQAVSFQFNLSLGFLGQVGASGVATIVFVALFVPAAVGWHRHLLGSDDEAGGKPLLKWTKAHWSYLGRLILVLLFVFLAAIAVMLPISALIGRIWEAFVMSSFQKDTLWTAAVIQDVAVAIVFTIACWIASLSFLVLPATAVGAPNNLKTAAALSYGNRGAMAGAIFLGVLAPLTAIYVLGTLSFVFALDALSTMGDTALTIFAHVTGIVIVTVEVLAAIVAVTLISGYFRRLAGPLPHDVSGAD